MAQTYGFDKLSIRVLKENREPDTSKAIHVIEGEAKKGAPVTMEITGLTKEAVKVWGGNVEYFIVRKGVGAVAANFGILDLPTEVEDELLGYLKMADGIAGIGNNTEAPYAAAFMEAEDLYGTPVAFALTAGTFNNDGFSLATKTDEDFTPEPGEYVYTAMSRKITIETKAEQLHVLRATGKEAVEKLKTIILGDPQTVPEG